jgi:magnesium-transporting ATPase (P-type)
MEAALDAFARRLGVDASADRDAVPDRKRFPFDPRRRRMSVVAGNEVLVKGAPDSVLPLCEAPDEARRAADAMAARGLRVLAMACRSVDERAGTPSNAAEAETRPARRLRRPSRRAEGRG